MEYKFIKIISFCILIKQINEYFKNALYKINFIYEFIYEKPYICELCKLIYVYI